ncbi:tetratricopeptide repeat protein [Methylobacterium sp. 77]|uniref:glycosyltransferase family 29 protein n=1 Tax=Methylobacterium sp. 77 TaxID=1101192 RepID=UPI0003702570|nr:tetratricopeptide repeat protein [Methylobacterium sp. 77]
MKNPAAPTKRQLKALGSEAEEAGNLVLAEEAYERALAIDPDDKEIVIKLLRVLIATKNTRRAHQLAEDAFANGQANTRILQMYVLSDFNSYTIAHCLDDVRAKLIAFPGHVAVSARAAIAFTWHGDLDEARIHARSAVSKAPDPGLSDIVRLILARRVLNFGYPDMADWICRIGRVGKGQDDAILYDRLIIRTGNAANDATTHRLFHRLLTVEDFPRRAELVEEHVDFLWRFNGPSHELLREIDDHLERMPDADNDALLLMKVCLAMQLGNEDIALQVLRTHPRLTAKISACLPVAKLVHRHRLDGPSKPDPDLASYAALYDALATSEAVLRQRLGDLSSSCAVVGNSPCEIGRGHGAKIDAHDDIVRFNRFKIDPPFDTDYGSRLTILVRAGNDKPDIGIDLPAETLIIISSGSTLYRGRAWRAAKRLRDEGHTLCVFPQTIHTELSQKLSGSPSSGLSFVYLLKALRGTLNRDDCFGFSFIDQIDANPASAHYFEPAKASMLHRWKKEREIFDSLFEERA